MTPNPNLLPKTALIPNRQSANGPVTTARLRRTASLYAAVVAVGVALAAIGGSLGALALGLGVIFPGGGFLVYAAGSTWMIAIHVGLFILTIVLFLLALFAWFGSGNVIAPVVVWLGAALWAASMEHAHSWPGAAVFVPALVATAVVLVLALRQRSFVRARARRELRNEYLAESRGVVTPTDEATGLSIVEELSYEDLTAMRFLLDRALQPVDEFNGFDWIEQFQTASVRYQVMATSYILSLAQANRLPALHGYLSEAQRNLIEKMKDHRVWRYWVWENAWGNFRLDPDPIAPKTHDNVMYSGWYAAMIGMYASNTGDHRYDEPGAITLRHPSGRELVYDWPKIVGILADNFERSDFTLFPCEPNWIYTMCNNYAGISLMVHDRLRGTDHWSQLKPRFRKGLENEFMTVDGRLVAIRSAQTGLTIPSLTSTMADSATSFFLHPLFPDIARRSWEIVRHDLLTLVDGGVHITLRGWDRIDTGNYRRSNATSLAAVAGAAEEMGDQEVSTAVRRAFDRAHPPVTDAGVRSHPGVSVICHATAFASRVSRANGMHDLVAVGLPNAWRDGPIVEDVSYPQVLVARAVSDGSALDLVAYPGLKAGPQSLGLSQLHPDGRYRCDGAEQSELVADATGRARVTVALDGRTELRVYPLE
jgi:hypothetical protein